jgi:LytS/YehU family sensor histidine kinase
MDNRFDYNITIDQKLEVDTIKIPKMLIYTFVENAVKHGISPLKNRGQIDIEVKKQNNNSLFVKISDNGIGRDNARKHPAFGTGKGLKILDEIIGLFYKLEKIDIHYDLKDGINGGTVAIIIITIK